MATMSRGVEDKALDKTPIQDVQLAQELMKIDWPLEYGQVRVKLREGRLETIAIERTIQPNK